MYISETIVSIVSIWMRQTALCCSYAFITSSSSTPYCPYINSFIQDSSHYSLWIREGKVLGKKRGFMFFLLLIPHADCLSQSVISWLVLGVYLNCGVELSFIVGCIFYCSWSSWNKYLHMLLEMSLLLLCIDQPMVHPRHETDCKLNLNRYSVPSHSRMLRMWNFPIICAFFVCFTNLRLCSSSDHSSA